jgi:acyl carrier protein
LAEGSLALRRCFAAVFPELSDDEIEAASVDTLAEWDSLASVTLVALVEEEFELAISEPDLPELRSYERIHDYLRREGRVP